MTSTDGGSRAGDDGAQVKDAGHVEHDTPMTATYVRVLIVEALIVIALWYFGTMFS